MPRGDRAADPGTAELASREWELRFGPNNRFRVFYRAVENDEELERLILAHSKRFRAILDASWQQIEEGHGIGHEAFWQEIEAGSEPRPAEAASQETARI